MTHFCKTIPSPVGRLTLVACDEALVAVLWEHERPGRVPLPALVEGPNHPVLLAAQRELEAYFAGTLKKFTIQVGFNGTPFQKAVWQALRTIPYGQTFSYGDIARQIGHPRAVRAVGAANGRNPISIITPCHRVVGHGGQLTGFAGGLEAKAFLLALEKAQPKAQPRR